MEIINGFQCKNCTDVDYAKKHIDPAHPKDGPYGVNAKDKQNPFDKAVKFGGSLSNLAIEGGFPAKARPISPSGGLIDLTA